VGTGSFPFDSSIHIRENPDKRLFREIRNGVDFGWTNPSAIVVVAYDYDGRVWVLDEFYKNQTSAADLLEKLNEFATLHGKGEVICDGSEPESIAKFKAGVPERSLLPVRASAYPHKREDGIRELGSRFEKTGDGLPRIFISSRCINLISELLEYKVDVKERDHAVDALRYALKLQSSAPLGAFRFG
jgi:phage terminase large subunit